MFYWLWKISVIRLSPVFLREVLDPRRNAPCFKLYHAAVKGLIAMADEWWEWNCDCGHSEIASQISLTDQKFEQCFSTSGISTTGSTWDGVTATHGTLQTPSTSSTAMQYTSSSRRLSWACRSPVCTYHALQKPFLSSLTLLPVFYYCCPLHLMVLPVGGPWDVM